MAGRADGRVRGGFPADPGRGDPPDHQDQPEVLRDARRGWRGCPTNSCSSPISPRRMAADIARGNGKVVRARLSDALYFWKTDQQDLPDLGDLQDSAESFGLDLSKPLDQRMASSTIWTSPSTPSSARKASASQRIASWRRNWRRWSAPIRRRPARAALLAKADLQTEMVRRIPRSAGHDGQHLCRSPGRGRGGRRGDRGSLQAAGPERPRARPIRSPIAVALADKLDTLVGFWAIDEKPTGLEGSLCAAPRGAGGDPDRGGEWNSREV